MTKDPIMSAVSSAFVDIVLDEIVFFATCDDAYCDPDIAVRMLESISGVLMRSGCQNDRQVLLERAKERSRTESKEEVRILLANLHEKLGFEEE